MLCKKKFLDKLSGLLMSGYFKKNELSDWADKIIRKSTIPDDWLIKIALIDDEKYFQNSLWISSVFSSIDCIWYGYRFEDFLWYGYIAGRISRDNLVIRYCYHDEFDDQGWDSIVENISKETEIARKFIECMLDEEVYENMPEIFEFGR